jgi:peptide/nickel transport system permease protein
MPERYVRWLGSIAQGDFGWSSGENRKASAVIADALPNTLTLMSLAFLASLAGGIALGAWQGAHAGSRRERVTSTAALVLYSLPEFFVALALMMVFAYWLELLPVTGMTQDMYYALDPLDKIRDRLEHLVLPWLSLTLVGVAVFSRFQRSATREAFREPFVQTARAKGLDERAVRRQVTRASLLPVLTLAGLLLPSLLTGAVLVEKIYAWPGMGYALLDAIQSHDYAVVTGIVVVGSAMTALGSLLADVARTVADPRTRA